MTIQEVELFIQWEEPSGSLAYLYFDCVETITHSHTAEYTDAPREDGSPVGDHAFNKADSLSVTGLVSDTPLPSNPGVAYSREELPNDQPYMAQTSVTLNAKDAPHRPVNDDLEQPAPSSGETSFEATLWTPGSEVDRIYAAFDLLRYIKRNFITCKVRTPLWTYSNLQILSINIPEIPQDSTVRAFSIEFKEVLTATATTVEAPSPTVIRAKPPIKKPTAQKDADKDADKEGKKEEKKSLLKKLKDGVFG